MRTVFFSNCRGTRLSPFTALSRVSAKRATLASALALVALASSASARQVDYSVASIEVNQAIQLGTTPLIAGRSTMVRATIAVTGTTAPVDGLMRVFADGTEIPLSPFFSDNGPFPAPLVPSQGIPNDTLNFRFIPPASSDVVVTIEINPAGPNLVVETDPNNNTLSTASLNFQVQRVAELAYANVDLDPTGGSSPNPAPTALIKPGVGDNFIQAIFPVSDWFYHRIDAPTKLWTASVAGSGSALVSSLAVDRQLMVPIPDYIYGWVNGSLSYNGVSTIGGPASMGNTQNIRHQRTFAHEIGHNFGLSHNSTKTNTIGIDVESHLKITEGLSLLKSPTLNDIMTPGLLTPQAWVATGNYNFFFNHATFNFAEAADVAENDGPRFLIAGLWNKATGAIEVTDSFTFEGGELTTAVPESEAQLVVRTYRNGSLSQVHPISVRSSQDECRGCSGNTDSFGDADSVIGFMAVVPANLEGQPAIDRVLVTDPAHQTALPHDMRRTQSAPKVGFLSPSGESIDGKITVSWSGSDADGDELTYYLRYSPTGSDRMVPLATTTHATELEVDMSELPAFVDGEGFFELIATDGLNTTRVQSAALVSSADSIVGNNPWIEVVSPDPQTRFKRGATIILHSSGWDLEDRKIQGASITWTSNLDGFIGTGRLLAVNTLSAGLHTITVEATDSDGMTSTDVTTAAISARSLPDTVICHPDLGFGGPGASVLTVCGGDLSTGTTFDVSLTGALPSTNGWIMGGTINNPTAAFGGTVVPVPTPIFVPININGSGEFLFAGAAGGGGPATLYLQILYLDAGQAMGVGLSNAVQLDFLP